MPLKEVRCSLCQNDHSRVSQPTCLSIRLWVQTQSNPLITMFECQTDAIVITIVINRLQNMQQQAKVVNIFHLTVNLCAPDSNLPPHFLTRQVTTQTAWEWRVQSGSSVCFMPSQLQFCPSMCRWTAQWATVISREMPQRLQVSDPAVWHVLFYIKDKPLCRSRSGLLFNG